MESKIPVAIARGDGIGPEIMGGVLRILQAVKAPLEFQEIEIGEKVYSKGILTGIAPESWDTIRNTKAFLKAPITTPQGGGFKSLNVTIRTTLGLYANVRPCRSLFPVIKTKHPEMDVVIVRENEEDLYSGIEYRQTPEVCQSLKLITRPGSEKIIRYAFEYAKRYGRKKVTCFTKDNIMKISDGLFHQVYDEVSKEYSGILTEHWIVDIGAAKLADSPEVFDVIVMPNLYGDILSDIAAQITGSVGLAGSANIGEHGAMFEAIHGSAPRRAGQNLANPSGLLQGAILMLLHIGLPEHAETVQNAWLKTLEDGIHTYDIYCEETSKQKVGTKEFSDAIISNLGKNPQQLEKVSYNKQEVAPFPKYERSNKPPEKRELVGVDVYIHAKPDIDSFMREISHINAGPLNLQMVTNRGVKVWPEGFKETFCVDHFRCRFISKDKTRPVPQSQVIDILHTFDRVGLDIIKSENLYTFDGKPAFSSAEV